MITGRNTTFDRTNPIEGTNRHFWLGFRLSPQQGGSPIQIAGFCSKVAATPTGLDRILDPQVLARLGAIGRYERLALSRRKAAKRRLDEIGGGVG